MAAPSYVFTIARVAEMLGEDEDWLQTIADDMEPEDGCLRVCGTDDTSISFRGAHQQEVFRDFVPWVVITVGSW